VELIFELSEKGRKGYRLPKLDVPAVDVAQYLGEYYRQRGLELSGGLGA